MKTCDSPTCPTPDVPADYIGDHHYVWDDEDQRMVDYHPWCCEIPKGDCLEEHPTCVFCDPRKIASPIEVYRVAVRGGSEWYLVFEPLDPVVPGHLLITPLVHVSRASALPRAAGQAAYIAAKVAQEKQHEAYNIITSGGAAATQTVPHLHWHLVPRVEKDGLPLPWTPQHDSPLMREATSKVRAAVSVFDDDGISDVAVNIDIHARVPHQKEFITMAIRKHGEGEVIPEGDQQKTGGMSKDAAAELAAENEKADGPSA